MTTPATSRAAVVALIGAPNAGKSTLVNALVGAKVSIVTHKAQTTRSRIRGVAQVGDAQLVLTDTPGIFAPRRRLDRAMVDAAWASAADADIVVVIVDAVRTDEAARILERLGRGPALLVLNKVDLVRREALLEISARLNAAHAFDETFMISALRGIGGGGGVGDLREALARRARPGPWLFPPDQLSDLAERLLAAEITREKAYLRLHDELPYALAVETDTWEEFSDGAVRIGQTIHIARESHKPIVLGRGGRTIRRIRELAQADLTEVLERRVHLFVRVKVSPRCLDDPAHYRLWGLRYDA